MGRPKKWGRFKISEAIDKAFENAKGEIEQLYEEMDEWRNNMEDSEGLSQTEKFSQVEEAADGLESAKDNLEYVDFSDLNLDLDNIEFIETRKRSCPRWMRCANAAVRIEAIREFLQNEVNKEENVEIMEKLEEQIGYLEEAFGSLESIDFPGMF